MAHLIGSISTSHVPAIGGALARQKQQDPYWKPFFDAYGKAREWLGREEHPDVVVILHNDHGLNFFLDKMPTFAVGAADVYRNADEGWGIPPLAEARGCVDLSWHIVETLVEDEFDITTCQEALVDHSVSLPLALLWPEGKEAGEWPVEIVPVCINTVLAPYPSAARCYRLGQSLRRAIESWTTTGACSSSPAAACRTSSTESVPVSSTSPSTCNSWTAWWAIRPGSPSIPTKTWSNSPALRGSSC